MENFEFLKQNLIKLINESSDRKLIFRIWEIMISKEDTAASGPHFFYESEKPLTGEQIKKGEFQRGDEAEKHFHEWLKN
ncbi:hypothetical protein [Chryseobacterium sp. R2A-55]|uniref:hypothetical protein n=1 Tax=Chryseobacterium sp. R2A-55 TaxID=2744445 RepID=UPI001F16741F|nr:hypothetical protein [Chryseobacterium sp. R2A-55]